MSEYRKCVKCKEEKLATSEFFYKDKNRALGLMYRCKECDRKKVDNRIDRYANLSPEQLVNKKEAARKYGKTNKGKAIFGAKAYQAFDKKKGLDSNITQHHLLSILDTPCTYCGYPSTGLDRINNKIGHTIENCVPACRDCNVARMDNFSHEEMKIIGLAIKQVKDSRLITI